jgi:endonuclease YncB( thermonuclease family)
MKIAALTVYNCEYLKPETPRSRLDGDTFRCLGDVEPVIPDCKLWAPKVRLVRVNAPETGDTGAEEARDALIEWLTPDPFNLHCYGRDKYGRLLADAEKGAGLLSQYMLDHKLVKPMSMAHARELAPEATEQLLRLIIHPSELHKSKSR